MNTNMENKPNKQLSIEELAQKIATKTKELELKDPEGKDPKNAKDILLIELDFRDLKRKIKEENAASNKKDVVDSDDDESDDDDPDDELWCNLIRRMIE